MLVIVRVVTTTTRGAVGFAKLGFEYPKDSYGDTGSTHENDANRNADSGTSGYDTILGTGQHLKNPSTRFRRRETGIDEQNQHSVKP